MQKKRRSGAPNPAPIPGMMPEQDIPKQVANAIAATADDFGVITPDGVVAAARDETSVLHRYFTWNTEDAAHQHRLAQARALIRKVEYIVAETPRRNVVTVNYVHRPGSHEQAYIPLSSAVHNKRLARDILREEMQRVESAIGRARKVAAALGLEASLESMIVDVARILEQAAA